MINILNNIFVNFSTFFSNVINTFLSCIKIVLMSKFGLKIKDKVMSNASILGNGPSLNETLKLDFDFLKQTEIYCVNNFASSEAFLKLQPQNYVLLDPAFFEYSLENNARKDIEKTIQTIINQVNWPLNLNVPSSAKKSFLVTEISRSNANISVNYFNYTILNGFNWFKHFCFAKNIGMPQCQNILGASLYLTITKGHDNIYLFGADHSWHEEMKLDESGELYGRQIHFYDNANQVEIEKSESFRKIHRQFQSLAKAFYSYEVLNEYAKYLNVKVLNASKKSYIDSFEKIKI